jgi:hypothetical protein
MAVISTANDMGGRSGNGLRGVNDVGQGGDVGVNIVAVEGSNTMDVDVQTGDGDVDILVEDVLETSEVEHGARAVALDVVVEGLLGEKSLDLSGGGSHCRKVKVES